MLKLVSQLVKPEKQVFRIEVLNILTPRVMIGTWGSSRVPTSQDYIELERHMSRVWSHAPAWKFPMLPSEGTLVMAMMKHKTNFKRGVILNVENVGSTRFFFVFLYDWGIIERFTMDELAQLRPEDEHKLLPRTFIMIQAGMVECRKKTKSRRKRAVIEAGNELKQCEGDDVVKNESTSRSHAGATVSEVKHFVRNWFDSRVCYMKMYKNFEGIIFICDVQAPMVTEGGRVKNTAFVYNMESEGFSSVDRKLRRLDKNYQLSNWESIVARLEGIDYSEVTQTKPRENNSENV